jgi:hypothetical protein
MDNSGGLFSYRLEVLGEFYSLVSHFWVGRLAPPSSGMIESSTGNNLRSNFVDSTMHLEKESN